MKKLLSTPISLFKTKIKEYKSIRKNHFLNTSLFPEALSITLMRKYPHLSQSNIEEILETMILIYTFSIEKENFYIPSRVVDFAFQTFVNMADSSPFSKKILSTHKKSHGLLPIGTTTSFSKELITVLLAGQHQPSINSKISEIWCYCCKKEHIDPFFPLSFPSIFTLDKRLKITSGFIYELDETPFRETHSIEGASSIFSLRYELQMLDEIERDIDYLAKKIQYYLGRYDYCNQYEREEFEKLFRIIDRNQPLAHIVYGKYSNVNSFQETILNNSAPSCGSCG